LFIGLPVYNGEDFLNEAIDSIRNQTFTDWIMLISDDNSEDRTESICKKYCEIDLRISYVKRNKGENAFDTFINSSDCEYFMFVADDDIYHTEFLSSCITNLENNPKADLAFCNIVNIDTYGRIIRDNYPDFSRFTSNIRLINVARCLLEPEIYGKANLIMSVFRLDFFKKMWQIIHFGPEWGIDNCFVLGILARTNLIVDKRVLFQKRIDRPTDRPEHADKIIIKNPYRMGIFPLDEAKYYLGTNLKVLKGTIYYYVAIPLVVYRYICCVIVTYIKPVKTFKSIVRKLIKA
jgi:glycosyltransferase involved in cell wall biosynthesis